MIISRTPFRISFFGGGTDYPAWYKENKGAVLSTTINKYCYIACRYLPPFFNYRYRIVYSKIELVNTIDKIQHPSAKAVLRFLNIKGGVEIHHDGDLPARTGLGSSSSFTVGCLNACYALKREMPSKEQLAQEAIHIEQNINKENVGSQDQTAVAFGGLNRIDFNGDHNIRVTPIMLKEGLKELLHNHLMIFFTGLSHIASDVAKELIDNVKRKRKELRQMYEMVNEAVEVLNKQKDLEKFGKLLHESWQLKRSLSKRITTPLIDDIYNAARRAGAIGGKLLGAGGGGFILIFAKPNDQPKIKEKLRHLLQIPFQFENQGSQIIFCQHDTREKCL
jgi:D-glycero-alpha-D-manno-heptose-7-phosphate kinase